LGCLHILRYELSIHESFPFDVFIFIFKKLKKRNNENIKKHRKKKMRKKPQKNKKQSKSKKKKNRIKGLFSSFSLVVESALL